MNDRRRPKPPALYLTAARMIDPARGEVVEAPAVVIEGDRIVAVGIWPGRRSCRA
jgi:hypothetical protein